MTEQQLIQRLRYYYYDRLEQPSGKSRLDRCRAIATIRRIRKLRNA